MKVICSWKISLPFKFQYTESINDIKTFSINEVIFRPIINKDNIIDSIITEHEVELPEDIQSFKDLAESDTIGLYKKYVINVGIALQNFADSYSRITDDIVYNLFNGKDITVKYEMVFKNLNLLNLSYEPDPFTTQLDKNKLDNIILDANKRERTLNDNIKEMLRYADHFHDLGNFEMCIINLSMAAESFICSILHKNGILDNNHNFKNHYKKLIIEEYGSLRDATFVERCYDLGLNEVYKVKLIDKDPEWHNSLLWIYDLRNTIAHGSSLYDNKYIKEFNIEYVNMPGILWSMKNDLISVFNWIDEIEDNKTEYPNS
jgi:hypothetical protein